MTNTVTIFQQCADKDLVDKLSGLKRCPETGRLYTRNQWQQKQLSSQKGSNDEEDKEELVCFSTFLLVTICCILLFIVLVTVYFLVNKKGNYLYYFHPLFVYRVQKRKSKSVVMTRWCGCQKM